MSTKSKLMEILTENTHRFVSGQELADMLGVSRNSVWKAVNSLNKDGFTIKALPSTGYKLIVTHDLLLESIIREHLDSNFRDELEIHILDNVDSTNNYAKSLPLEKSTACSVNADAYQNIHPATGRITGKSVLVLADSQSAGRGRMGRSFYSPKGSGLYMSFSFKPYFDIKRAMLVTSMAALACCHAISRVTGLNPGIKWVNDIYIDDKKVGGILTEASTSVENGSIERMTIGIGINCFEFKLPPDIKNSAAWLKNPVHRFNRNQLAAEIVNCFMEILGKYSDRQIAMECSSRSVILGKTVLVFNPAIAREIGKPESKLNEGIRAKAIDIDENGGLVVEILEGRSSRLMLTLTSGEVSIRSLGSR